MVMGVKTVNFDQGMHWSEESVCTSGKYSLWELHSDSSYDPQLPHAVYRNGNLERTADAKIFFFFPL